MESTGERIPSDYDEHLILAGTNEVHRPDVWNECSTEIPQYKTNSIRFSWTKHFETGRKKLISQPARTDLCLQRFMGH